MDNFDKPPASLRPIQPYLVVYKQFLKRDPVMSYFALLYAAQEGIRLSKSDPLGKAFLVNLMDHLEKMKKSLAHEEALSSDIVGQAHVESVGLKLFEFADQQDREANFHKNMIKAFFTSTHVFSILKYFGELSEEIESKQKYAKWKAVEIDRCLKSGITPTAGPPGDGMPDAEDTLPPSGEEQIYPGSKPIPKPRHQPQFPPSDISTEPVYPVPSAQALYPPSGVPTAHPLHPPSGVPTAQPLYPPSGVPSAHPLHPPSGVPTAQPLYPPSGVPSAQPLYPPSGVPTAQPPQSEPSEVTYQPSPEDVSQVQKLCKFASSALDYEDVTGAVEYLSEALQLLKGLK